MKKKQTKFKEYLEEIPFKYKKVNGLTWLEFTSEMRGFGNFTYKGKEVFKFQLFWSGITPVEIIFSRNGFSCDKITNYDYE